VAEDGDLLVRVGCGDELEAAGVRLPPVRPRLARAPAQVSTPLSGIRRVFQGSRVS
jgi:hypothetical protein